MSSWLFLSSGNLIADRRFDFGRDLQLRGDLSAAADLMMQAVELEPRFASAWFSLGELREQLGEREEAINAYRRARDADPADRHGAKLRLMRLGAEDLSDMPAGYVTALFDQYAPKFDKSLVEDLNYRGPQVLLKAVLAARHAAGLPARFRKAIDLGCGTGLAAQEFASVVDEFIGVDLSSGMIKQAEATGLYVRLDVADMLKGLRAEADAGADLVMAADAFVYVPDLAPIIAEAARVMQPQGMLAFTVEANAGEGFILKPTLRYAHSVGYLRAMLEDAGLTVSAITSVSTRTEAGEAVPGLVVTASKS